MEGEVAERGRVAMGAQTRRKHTVYTLTLVRRRDNVTRRGRGFSQGLAFSGNSGRNSAGLSTEA